MNISYFILEDDFNDEIQKRKLTLRKKKLESCLNSKRNINESDIKNKFDSLKKESALLEEISNNEIDRLYNLLNSISLSLSIIDNEISYEALKETKIISLLLKFIDINISNKKICLKIFECLNIIVKLIKDERCYDMFYSNRTEYNKIYINLLSQYEKDNEVYKLIVTLLSDIQIVSVNNQNITMNNTLFRMIYEHYNNAICFFNNYSNDFIPFFYLLSSYSKIPYDDNNKDFQKKVQDFIFTIIKQLYFIDFPFQDNQHKMLTLIFQTCVNLSQSTESNIYNEFFIEDISNQSVIQMLFSFTIDNKNILFDYFVTIIGNLVTNGKEIMLLIYKCDILSFLISNLKDQSTQDRTKGLIIWAISNICDESSLIELMFQLNVFSILLLTLHTNPSIETLTQILWCFGNGIISCDYSQCLEFLNIPLLEELKNILTTYKDPLILLRVLQCLNSLFEKGNISMTVKGDTSDKMMIDNVYVLKFCEVGGEDILHHISGYIKNETVINYIDKILSVYYNKKE